MNGAIEMAAAVDRLAHGTGGARRAGQKFVAALESGATPANALDRSGVRGAVAQLIEAAAPAELEPVLRELGVAVELANSRSQAVRNASRYPLLLAVVAVLLSWLIESMVLPSLGLLRMNLDRLYAPVSAASSMVALTVSAITLVLLAISLRSRRSLFPFARERRQQERALIVAGAATLARHGTPLALSLRAGAHLSISPQLSADCVAIAVELESGASNAAGTELLGETGAALFKAAASEGAGAESLTALAELHESAAAGELPGLLLRAELSAMLLGGLGILAGGAAFYSTYSGLLAGAP